MREYKSLVIALIAAVSAVACVSIFTGGLLDYKKTGGRSGITATGSASCDFESDLIVWRGSFSVHGDTPKDAYSTIKEDAELVKKYLEENGVAGDEMVFSSINISQTYTSRYDEEGRYLGEEQDGYDLTQGMTVTSHDIDKVEEISRDITTLIEAGVELESQQPEYYYTKLDEMKLDLIEKDAYRFCYVNDFPMFERDPETKKIGFTHNPFSMPQGGLEALNTMNPLDILAYQYDIVCIADARYAPSVKLPVEFIQIYIC